MNPLFEAAREVGALFAERGGPYCVIGDWLDAEGIVARQGTQDAGEILARLGPLLALKEAPELLDRARRLLAEAP